VDFSRAGLNTNIRMPSTEIILTENVPGLGAEADVVKVRRGYARNFLLPQGKAYEVTKRSLRQLDNLKAKRAAREAAELNEAEDLSRRIGKLRVTFTLETGETGKAFGSITAQDLVKRLKNELGNEIDRHQLVLEHPIKTTGEHEVPIKLHHDVTAKFVFQVKPSKEEAPAPASEPTGEITEKARPFRKRTDHK
jgi:large subunit ribosomal protein L9